MNLFRKTLFTGFAPNLQGEDVSIALSYIFCPWKWPQLQFGETPEKVEAWLKKFFQVRTAVTYDSGRTALAMALRALDAGRGCDVLVQAYTCVVVVNAIQITGAQPIFVDTKDHFFMDPVDAEKKITPRTKIMIIQHTFGITADMDRLMALAKKYRLRVIEDCAHTIGGAYRKKLLGTVGNVGIFSFGSDKIISCVRGGAAITNDTEAGERLLVLQKELPPMSKLYVFRHLLHFPIFFIGKPFYHLGVGKIILWLAKYTKLIPPVISDKEKGGEADPKFPTRFPNALGAIALSQLAKVNSINEHRKGIAQLYAMAFRQPIDNNCPYLRFPLIVPHPEQLRAHAKKNGILLGDWYDAVVTPCLKGCPHVGYITGTCPHAESDAKGSLNLPTDIHISTQDAKRIIECIQAYGI